MEGGGWRMEGEGGGLRVEGKPHSNPAGDALVDHGDAVGLYLL